MSYNEETGELILNTIPTFIHETLGPYINDEVSHALDQYSPSGRSKTDFIYRGSPKLNYFFGEAHAKTAREPDAAIFSIKFSKWPLVVVESGFSESYFRIMQDMSLWLDNAPVKAVITFIVHEVRKASLVLDENYNIIKTPDKTFKYTDQLRSDTYLLKPLEHQGYIVVGELSVICQVWRRKYGDDGVHIVGGRKDFETCYSRKNPQPASSIPLKLGDFGLSPVDNTIDLDIRDLWERIRVSAENLREVRLEDASPKKAKLFEEAETALEAPEDEMSPSQNTPSSVKGCSCKEVFNCESRRCGCKKNGTACTPDCHPSHRNCANLNICRLK